MLFYLNVFIVFYFVKLAGSFAEALDEISVTTWAFVNASAKSWEVLKSGGLALDAVQAGCTACEQDQCDFTVGYGGSPDENGETILDAMLMDGNTLNVGAVAGLKRIKWASAVARKVLDNTLHSLLVGDLATAFAKSMGFMEENLTTNHTIDMIKQWRQNKCQPNFWTDVTPDPKLSCGPYKPSAVTKTTVEVNFDIGAHNHDTIGMVALDSQGNMAAGTSSNGAKYKIPGRVGDSPIPGAGSYADSAVGAAAATGDGDIMMRFLPSFLAVEELRRGGHPRAAAETAINRISERHPDFSGGIVVLRKDGKFAAACHGLEYFPYTVSSRSLGTKLLKLPCI